MKKIITCLLALLMTVTLVACGGNNNKEIQSSNAFFIKNSDDNYALFTTKGKKVSDYKYKSAGDIIQGSAIVTDKKGKYGIINSKDETLVKFGKYDSIERVGALFTAKTKKKTVLLNALGDVIETKKDYTSEAIDNCELVVVSDNESVQLLNEMGNTVVSFKFSKKADKPVVRLYKDDELLMMYYNGVQSLISLKTKTESLNFKAKKAYEIHQINPENKEQIILSTIADPEKKDEVLSYQVINENKITISSESKYLSMDFENNMLVVEEVKSLESYIIDISGKELFAIERNTFVNSKNYINYKDGETQVVNFYSDGAVVKTVEGVEIKANVAAVNSGLYILNSVDSAKFGTKSGVSYFYKTDGTKLTKKEFKKIDFFDQNKVAIVSEDGTNYYLINTSGQYITDAYQSISKFNDDLYMGKNDKAVTIVDKKGKTIISGEYTNVMISKSGDKTYLVAVKEDSTTDLVDIDNKKVVLSTKDSITFNDKYIVVNSETPLYYTSECQQIKN